MNYICCLLALVVGAAQAGELRGGIFLNGSALEIRVRVASGSGDFNSEITAVAVSVKYDAASTAVFGSPETPAGMDLVLQTVQTSVGYTYAFYSWVGAYTPQWTQGSEYVILRIPVSGLTGSEEFHLSSGEALVNGNDPNFYLESPLGGGYFDKLYKPSTSAPVFADRVAAPLTLQLHVWPHPVTSTASVLFAIPQQSTVQLSLRDASGRVVRVLVDEIVKAAGAYQAGFETAGLPSGLYWAVLRTRDAECHQRLLLLR